MKSRWILIANASRARLLGERKDNGLELLQEFEHPQSRLRGSELDNDTSGRAVGASGFGAMAMSPRLNPKRKEHERFARELAKYIDHAARCGTFESLAVFSANPFLGELRQSFGAATRRIEPALYAVDLTAVRMDRLPRRMREARFAAANGSRRPQHPTAPSGAGATVR